MILECPNITRKANERSVMDIARGELVERQLDNLITRRSKQKVPEEESEAWLLTRLAEWVSENPRHQGYANKALAELDALASEATSEEGA
jgi:hypothetical protein